MRIIGMWFLFTVGGVLIFTGACAGPERPSETDAGSYEEPAPKALTLMACYQLGVEARGTGDWESASDAFVDAVELAPDSPSMRLYAAGALARLGDVAASLEHLDAAVRLGATTDLTEDDAYADLIDKPEFTDINIRLLANGAPLPPAEIVHLFDDAELWPEGIAVDASTGDIYVGSIHRHAVVKLESDGSDQTVLTSAADDLMEVIGIWVDSPRRQLWAATGEGPWQEPFDGPPRRNEIVRYDLESGRLNGRWAIPEDELRMLNDVTVGPDGTAWISESLRGEVFRVTPDGALELFSHYPELVFANGITISEDGERIYLGHFAGVSLFSPGDRRLLPVRGPDMALGMVDGLSWSGGGLVIVQNNPRVNFRVIRADLGSDGITAERLDILHSGLPEGLIPYTSAIDGDTVVVVAASTFDLMDRGEVPPPPAVVRMPLNP